MLKNDMKIRIYYEDTDVGGIVYHTNYIKYCERARSELMFAAGIKFSTNRYFVVKNIEANFVKSAVLGDILEVRTLLDKIGKASITLKQNIYRVENLNKDKFDELIFSSKITLAFMNNSKVERLHDDIIEFFS